MGLSLAAIADLIQRRTLDAGELINLRLAQVEAERARLTILAASLRGARAALQGAPVDAAALAFLLADPETLHFQQLIDRWFAPAEQQAWHAAGIAFDRAAWDDLRERVSNAVAAGVPPDSAKGMALGAAWYAALQPTIHGIGPALWNRGTAMFQNPDEPGIPEKMKPVYAWLFLAIPAAADAGLLPAANSSIRVSDRHTLE